MANKLTAKAEALAVRVEYRDGRPVDYVRRDEVLALLAVGPARSNGLQADYEDAVDLAGDWKRQARKAQAQLRAVEAVLDGRQPIDIPGALMVIRHGHKEEPHA